jgi:RimJ/RimL family protein N-acetyltransferase
MRLQTSRRSRPLKKPFQTSTAVGKRNREPEHVQRTVVSLPFRCEDLLLRRLTVADLRDFQTYRTDPVVGQYQGWEAMSDAYAVEFLQAMNRNPFLQPGSWSQVAIADATSDALLGDIGLLHTSDQTQVEIGFTLAPMAQGRGLASIAVRAAIDVVFAHTNAARVLATTDERNIRSIALLERIGMQRIEIKQAKFRGEPCVEWVYEMRRAIGNGMK